MLLEAPEVCVRGLSDVHKYLDCGTKSGRAGGMPHLGTLPPLWRRQYIGLSRWPAAIFVRSFSPDSYIHSIHQPVGVSSSGTRARASRGEARRAFRSSVPPLHTLMDLSVRLMKPGAHSDTGTGLGTVAASPPPPTVVSLSSREARCASSLTRPFTLPIQGAVRI